MATTVFSKWFFDTIARVDPSDYSPALVKVSFFVRAPHLEEDTTDTGWAAIQSVNELFTSPHWQVPGKFVDGEYVPGTVAGTTSMTLVPAGGDGFYLAELFSDFEIDGSYSDTAQPVIAMAFWVDDSFGDPAVDDPVVCMIRLDAPILVTADADHPATISTAALFGMFRHA